MWVLRMRRIFQDKNQRNLQVWIAASTQKFLTLNTVPPTFDNQCKNIFKASTIISRKLLSNSLASTAGKRLNRVSSLRRRLQLRRRQLAIPGVGTCFMTCECRPFLTVGHRQIEARSEVSKTSALTLKRWPTFPRRRPRSSRTKYFPRPPPPPATGSRRHRHRCSTRRRLRGSSTTRRPI